MRLADAGIGELQRYVDTLIVIPNQNLFRIANERTTFAEAFGMADQVLHSGVRSITDLMVLPGLINLDFADVRTVMTEMGKAMMGTGEATGDDRALMAAQNAIQNPLLDEVSLKGAKAVLVNVTGGLDMTLLEVDEAANAISAEVDADANIIFGAAFDPALDGKVRVSVVATGMDGQAISAIEPKPIRAAEPAPRPVEQPKPQPVAAAPAPQPVAAAAPQPQPEPEIEIETEVEVEVPLVAAMQAPKEPEISWPTARSEEPETDDLDLRLPAAARAKEEEEAPMFADRRHEERQHKGGFFSLFGGRPRYDAPEERMPQFRNPRASAGAAALAVEPEAEADPEAEDLEIPSFLRRLAN
jgi:cell division protein FtsZ